MTEWFWKRLSFLAGWLAIAFLFGCLFLAASIEIKDLDLWLHLGAGRYILEHHRIPLQDIFSCTVSGTPWINHEWLFQVLVWSVYQSAGFDGLIGLQILVIAVTFALLLMLGYDRERQSGAVFVLLLVILIYQFRFTLRPEIFSLLFFVVDVYILAFHLNSRRALWALFLVQVLWTNMHGFFILGPVLVGTQWLGEWTKRRVRLPWEWNKTGRLNNREYHQLKELCLVVLLACLFNPNFLKGALYPLRVFLSLPGDSRVFFQHIQELHPPLSWATVFSLDHQGYFKILILISFLGFIWNFRRLDVGMLLLWLIFLVFSLQAVRNMVFFAFVAYLAFLANNRDFSPARMLRLRLPWPHCAHWAVIGFKVVLIVWMVRFIDQNSLRGYYDFDHYRRKSEFGGISLRNYPYKAVNFLVANNIRGNFFNDFNSGAYLIGRTFPNIRVFIDGRTEEYGANFFKTYEKIWKGDRAAFEHAAADYRLTGAFLNSVYVPAPAEFLSYLYERKDWVLVYFDDDAAIFLRDVPENKGWIERYAMDLSRWQTPPADLLKLGLYKATPYRYVNRAYALFNMKFYDKALREAEEGLKVEPYNAELYMLLGKIALKEKNYGEAFEQLRKARLIDPSDVWTRYYLALSFYRLGEIPRAREQCQWVLARRPDHAKALYLMAMIYAQGKDYAVFEEFLKKAVLLEPQATDELVNIAETLSRQGQYARAKEVYALALAAGPANDKIKKALEEMETDTKR
ncbi:MAG: tetratricopeptide repeat protein [Candidatus Omnitrophica bacterium]|nr:tetratricopeptide repeat protein [Candidatus Omnitrophota bacterium]